MHFWSSDPHRATQRKGNDLLSPEVWNEDLVWGWVAENLWFGPETFFPCHLGGVGQEGAETVSKPGGCQQGMVGAGALRLGSLSGHGQVPVLSSSPAAPPTPCPTSPQMWVG